MGVSGRCGSPIVDAVDAFPQSWLAALDGTAAVDGVSDGQSRDQCFLIHLKVAHPPTIARDLVFSLRTHLPGTIVTHMSSSFFADCIWANCSIPSLARTSRILAVVIAFLLGFSVVVGLNVVQVIIAGDPLRPVWQKSLVRVVAAMGLSLANAAWLIPATFRAVVAYRKQPSVSRRWPAR